MQIMAKLQLSEKVLLCLLLRQTHQKIWNWNESDQRLVTLRSKMPKDRRIPDSLFFAVRNTTGTAKGATTLHEQSLKLMQRFIEDKPTTKTEK